MRHAQRFVQLSSAVVALVFVVGCGTVRETLPARSAMEALVVTTSVDRAVDKLPTAGLEGKKVFVDTSNLEATDKAYVTQSLRDVVLESGAVLTATREEADIALEVASGSASLNKRDYLFGLPNIPFPIPGAGDTLKFPEIPIFKAIFYRGKTKLRISAVDVKTSQEAFNVPMCFGNSYNHFWWILLFGPFETSDLPEGIR